ncbi:MAG: hypothetical protein MZU84_04935 [Sphingobacterium sp.]|nr:hypothetical protein [Sphingobacterium sp.]
MKPAPGFGRRFHHERRTAPDRHAVRLLALAKALLDGFSEGVVVFDAQGKVLYANQPARDALTGLDLQTGTDDLLPRLSALGGRLRPLRVGNLEVGEAMFIPGMAGPATLAERERDAIVKMLDANAWKLAETAKNLGISRTTLLAPPQGIRAPPRRPDQMGAVLAARSGRRFSLPRRLTPHRPSPTPPPAPWWSGRWCGSTPSIPPSPTTRRASATA